MVLEPPGAEPNSFAIITFLRGMTMKVAYIFSTSGHTVSYKLGQMILHQLDEGLAKVAKEKNILLMMCDSCALERGLADGRPWPEKARPKDTDEGVQGGCFPDLCAA